MAMKDISAKVANGLSRRSADGAGGMRIACCVFDDFPQKDDRQPSSGSYDDPAMLPAGQLLAGQNRLAAVPCFQHLRDLIKEFGLTVPVVLDNQGQILSGCEQFLAAFSLGSSMIPCVYADRLTVDELAMIRSVSAEEVSCGEWDDILGNLRTL